MSHSPCGPNGTKWRRIAPLNRRLGQFELYSQKYTVSPIRGSWITSLLAPSSAKIRRERSPRRTLSADSIAQGSRRSPPDGGTPQSLPHRFQISQFAGATLASPEVQLASQRIRRVQFSVNAIPVRLHSACLTGNVFGHGAATAGTSFGSLWRCSKTSAVASFSIWLRKAAGLVSPTRCGHISRRTTASTRLTPTPHSASMTMSATTASPHACSGCFTARGSVLTNDPAKLNGLTKAALKLPAGADQCRQPPYRSLDFRFEEFLRTRRAHVGLGDKGYPGIDIG